MKNTKAFSFGILGILVLQLALAACDKPKQREETIDKEIKAHLVEISALRDLSTDAKAYFYKNSVDEDIASADKDTVQLKADDTIIRVLDMVKKEDSKKYLDEHLQSGLIAFAVMTNQVKIYKVMTKEKASAEHSALDLSEVRKIKKASLEAAQISTVQIDISDSKSEVQFVEVAVIDIEKSGVLENKKTKYYNEKTSILTVGERPLDVSTHLLLKVEESKKEDKK